MSNPKIDPQRYRTGYSELFDLIQQRQVVPESAKIGLETVVDFMTQANFTGSWWSLPESSRLYNALQPLRHSSKLLVCRLLKGRITYVHSDSWAALLSLESFLPEHALDRVVERHLPSGKHETVAMQSSDWASAGVRNRAARLTHAESIGILSRRVEPSAWGIIDRLLRST